MKIAECQHGVVTRRQMIESGMSSAAIGRMALSKHLERMYAGVYRVGGSRRSREQELMAVCLSYQTPAWLSHYTAAEIHGLKVWRETYDEVTVSSEYEPPKRVGFRAHRTQSVDSIDFTVVDDLPVTTVARTIVDLAQHLEKTAIGIVIDDVLMRNLTSLKRIEDCFHRVGRWAGRKRFVGVKEALEMRSGTQRAESGLERKILRLIRDAKLPKPKVQHSINVEGFRYRLDMAYPSKKFAIEVDGFATHRERGRFDSDRDRDARLQMHGWKVLHVTSNTTDDLVVDRIIHFLHAS